MRFFANCDKIIENNIDLYDNESKKEVIKVRKHRKEDYTMEERRRSRRLPLDVALELERIDHQGITTLKYVHIEVQDLSKAGLGFHAEQELSVDSFYNVNLEIWTKEIIHTIIKIVRCKQRDGFYEYGAQFVGMTEADALKIQIYQMLDEASGDQK